MFAFLMRVAFFIGGLTCLLDAGLPVVTETMHVDGHANAHQFVRNNATTSSEYTLQLIGGRVASVSVGYQAYNSVNDGDTVTVKTSKIFRRCLKIEKDGEEIYSYFHWKIFSVILGVVLIAAALGWGNNREGNNGFPDFD